MARVVGPPRVRPAQLRADEDVSSKVAAAQSGATSRQPRAKMPGLQPYASAAPALRTKPIAAARRQHRYARCPPLRSLAADSRRKPGPSTLLTHCDAIHRAKPERSPHRKL